MAAPARGIEVALPPVSVLVVRADAAQAAFAAHAALVQAEAEEPALVANPYWHALRDAAYARFYAAFEIA